MHHQKMISDREKKMELSESEGGEAKTIVLSILEHLVREAIKKKNVPKFGQCPNLRGPPPLPNFGRLIW